MKRLTLLTILLVVVGLTAGFALEVKPSFTLSGWGKVEWGIDLDTMYTGFNNTSDADLTVTFMAADGTDTHAGTGDWFGSITISDIEVWLGGDDAASITGTVGWLTDADVAAKIVGMGGKLAIGVFTNPDTGSNTDFVAAIENDTNDVDDDVFLDDEQPLDVDTSYGAHGTYASYTVTDMITVGLEVVSFDDWTLNTANAYAFALDVKAVFAPVTVTAGVNYGVNYASNPMGFGLKVSADTAMIDPYVSFDGQLAGTTFAWEVGAGATATFMETVTAALTLVYGDAFDNLDVKLVLTEPAAKGLVDNLDITLSAWVLDIAGLGPMEYKVVLDGGYLMGKLYPNFTVTYYDDTNDAAWTVNGQVLNLVVGVDFTGIPLTTLGLYYTSGNLVAATPVVGKIVASAKVAY